MLDIKSSSVLHVAAIGKLLAGATLQINDARRTAIATL
jgi:hypothetical protein